MAKLGLLVLLLGLMSSCAYHTGNVSSGAYIDCPLLYTAKGTAKVHKLLGIGGIEREALIMEAKQDLYGKYPYSKSIKLTNFAVDFQHTFIFIYSSTKVTVSADVFDCAVVKEEGKIAAPQDLSITIGGLQKGDSILYNYLGEFSKGVFLKYTNNGKQEISYENKVSKKTVTKRIKPSLVFKTTKDDYNKTYYGYSIGEEAFIEVYNREKDAKTKKPCTVIGLNAHSAIISYLKDDGTSKTLVVKKTALKK